MFHKYPLSRYLLRAVSLLAAALCLQLIGWLLPGLLPTLEERSGDWAWRLGAHTQTERRFVIVDIDEASLAEVGPWPWPRERLASLSQRLAAAGSPLHIYDIIFSEPRAGDAALAAAFQRSPSVLAQVFAVDQGGPASAGQLQGALQQPACSADLPQSQGFVANSAALVGAGAGHITPRVAADGAIRQLPAIVCDHGRPYVTLGLAAFLAGAGMPAALELSPGQGALEPAQWLRSPTMPELRVPLDAAGNVRVAYRLRPDSFISVSAADVLAGRIPADVFKGAWTLIGATAFGLGDAVPTPFGGAVGGVGVHAQFLSALLDDSLPYTPRAAVPLQAGLALGAAVLLLALTARRGRFAIVALPLAGLVLAGLLYALHAWLLLEQRLWLGWAAPATFALLASLLLASVEHARTRIERERLFANLTSYLPAPVARVLALRRLSSTIEAERRDISVLFADIRNFSAYCESRPADEVAAVLHAFFTTATRVVEAHGGVLESFQGDAVMAIWNAPQPCADHSGHALAAARELLRAAEAEFPDATLHGLEPLALGIGIESGAALVGSLGTARRRTHTALGRTVTIAARLQQLTAELACPILLGAGAAEQLASHQLLPQGSFLLEGLRHPHSVYAATPVA